jgi:flagellar protein FliO/FliZ
MPTQLTFFILFVAILALVGIVVWLVRRFTGNRLGSNANRGRMPRLAVIDAATVDNRRRLVLVRRDNVEHLLMIGGPSDVVIEPNIVRAVAQRDQVPQRGPIGADLPPRVVPLPDAGSWPEPADIPDYQEPAPAVPDLPPRPVRPTFAEDVRRPSPIPAERRAADPLAGLTPEPIAARPEPPPRPRAMSRSEPLIQRAEPLMPRSPSQTPAEPAAKAPPLRAPERPVASAPVIPSALPAPPAPPTMSPADQNLAEMAQRLEAALRKPAGEPAAPDRAPPVAPEAPRATARPAPEVSVNPPPRSEAAAPPVSAPGPKVSFENLEDEMASLLGRPKTPT